MFVNDQSRKIMGKKIPRKKKHRRPASAANVLSRASSRGDGVCGLCDVRIVGWERSAAMSNKTQSLQNVQHKVVPPLEVRQPTKQHEPKKNSYSALSEELLQCSREAQTQTQKRTMDKGRERATAALRAVRCAAQGINLQSSLPSRQHQSS